MKIISDKGDLRVRQFLANVNFQIGVALACLLDIRIKIFEYVKVLLYEGTSRFSSYS